MQCSFQRWTDALTELQSIKYQATDDEVRAALIKGGKPTKALIRVADLVDLRIRDAGFDPFKCVVYCPCLSVVGGLMAGCT